MLFPPYLDFNFLLFNLISITITFSFVQYNILNSMTFYITLSPYIYILEMMSLQKFTF